MFVVNSRNGVTVKAYRGDAMTLLAFNVEDGLLKRNFVGFSIKYETPSGTSNFLVNRINFEGDGKLTESDKAPFQKFRWIHVPGTFHQSLNSPEYGTSSIPLHPDTGTRRMIRLRHSIRA